MNLKELLDTIRDAADPEVWSEAVMVSRHPVLDVESVSDDEVVVRVSHPHTKIAAQVHLFPEELDWTCSVHKGDDPNVFVCAAVIGFKKLHDAGGPIATKPSGAITYPLRVKEDYICMERAIVGPDPTYPVTSPLTTLAKTPNVPAYSTEPHDLAIDKLIGFDVRGPLNGPMWHKILAELAGSGKVTLDGKPCQVGRDLLNLEAVITDEGPGIFIKGRMPLEVRKTFKNGLALTDEDMLVGFKHMSFPPPLHEWLTKGHFVSRQDLGNFVAETLPTLEQRCTVIKSAKNLPEAITMTKLSIVIEAIPQASGCLIVAKLVYGDPPLAEVTGEGFFPLGPLVPIRAKDREHQLRDTVWQKYQLTLGRPKHVTDAESVKLLEKWRREDIVKEGSGWKTYHNVGTLIPNLSFDGDSVSLSFKSEDGAHEISAAAVAKKSSRGGSQLFVDGVGGFDLPEQWLAEHSLLVQQLVAGKELTDLQKTVLAPSIMAAMPAEAVIPEHWKKRADRLKALLAHDTLPDGMTLPPLEAKPRPYQEQGIQWLAQLQNLELGGILADDMGLGKTLQVLAVVQKATLIVVPTTLLFNWVQEMKKFRPDLDYLLYHGASRKWPTTMPKVLLTSYGVLRLEKDRFAEHEFDLIVADEAHGIKNADSQTAQAMHQLQGHCRIALTGTPVENHVGEIWSVYRFALPELLGDEESFKELYLDAGAQGLLQLKNKLQPFLLRRLKEDVAKDLPPKMTHTLWIDLADSEMATYEAVKTAVRKDMGESGSNVMQLLELILRLRQASCHGQLLPGIKEAQSSKLAILRERLQEIREAGLQALVFSQWTQFLDLIEAGVREDGHAVLRIDGSTKDRQGIVEKFQSAKESNVLLMSLKAGGVGLNLTAADHVFIMDPWWNPAAEQQAADRAHRIGRERPVFVHKLIARQTIEEAILALQQRKAGLAEALLDGQGTAGNLTRDDLLELLQGAVQF